MRSSVEVAAETYVEAEVHSKEASTVRLKARSARLTMPPPKRLKNSELILPMVLVAFVINIAARQATSDSKSRDLIRSLLKNELDQIYFNPTLSAEEKKEKSLELIKIFLSHRERWAYFDPYRKETVEIPMNEFNPVLILLANRLSENKPLYLDEFLGEGDNILLEDLVKLNLYLELEIGLHVEKDTNRIVLNHGITASGHTLGAAISRPEPRNRFRMFAHTHPTDSREDDQFKADIRKKTPGLELVITAGRVIVYFDCEVVYNQTEISLAGKKVVLGSLRDGLSVDISINHPVNLDLIEKLHTLEADIAERASEKIEIPAIEESFGSFLEWRA